MRQAYESISCLLASVLMLTPVSAVVAQNPSALMIELEAGPVWQSRNNVQIPNDETGTRFSLVDLVGNGPWPAGRIYLTWNINRRHGLRALLAPLAITESGSLTEPVDFAGEGYQPGAPVQATYKFNSWRLSYRYRFVDHDRLRLWIGATAKIRDAKIELRQTGTSSKDTDVGFVPLVHLAADCRFASRWHALFDFDGLAGGPGRAFDVALKLGYDLDGRWSITGGYRTIEGGADVDSVYTFAWFHHGVVSTVFHF